MSYFYTIPASVWNSLQTEIPAFKDGKSQALMKDLEISKAISAHWHGVGFHRQELITYDLLASKSQPANAWTAIPPEFKEMDDWKHLSDQNLQLATQTAEPRFAWIHRGRRGYCGWLMTNTTFLSEHNLLFRTHASVILELGTNIIRVASERCLADSNEFLPADGGRLAFAQAIQAFCSRWQLSGMAGPYLPIPQGVQTPVLSNDLLAPSMLNNGILLYLPFTFPLPSEDELRSMISDALTRRAGMDHISDWIAVVSTKNANKGRQMERYGRVFEIQHFLRLLTERHPTALINNKQKAMRAFAKYYNQADIDTMKDDFKLIEDASISDPVNSSTLV